MHECKECLWSLQESSGAAYWRYRAVFKDHWWKISISEWNCKRAFWRSDILSVQYVYCQKRSIWRIFQNSFWCTGRIWETCGYEWIFQRGIPHNRSSWRTNDRNLLYVPEKTGKIPPGRITDCIDSQCRCRDRNYTGSGRGCSTGSTCSKPEICPDFIYLCTVDRGTYKSWPQVWDLRIPYRYQCWQPENVCGQIKQNECEIYFRECEQQGCRLCLTGKAAHYDRNILPFPDPWYFKGISEGSISGLWYDHLSWCGRTLWYRYGRQSDCRCAWSWFCRTVQYEKFRNASVL